MSEDADDSGGGDGVASTLLGPLFKSFTRSIPKEGTMLDLRFSVLTTNESVIIDNIAVFGTTDVTAPTASAPTSVAQTLRGTITSTSTVESTEFGNIYLVRNGVAAASQANIDAAVTANDAFLGRQDAQPNTPYTVTPLTTLNDGVYDIVAVDAAGNVSSIVAGWLTVDNTPPSAPAVVSISTDSGISGTDEITNDNTITLNSSPKTYPPF